MVHHILDLLPCWAVWEDIQHTLAKGRGVHDCVTACAWRNIRLCFAHVAAGAPSCVYSVIPCDAFMG